MRDVLQMEWEKTGLLAISQTTNRKNKSPVTAPGNRCNGTEPLDQHQVCTIISHVHEVSCLASIPACFVTLWQLYPSRPCHITVRQVGGRAPAPDYPIHDSFTARFLAPARSANTSQSCEWIASSLWGSHRKMQYEIQAANRDNTAAFWWVYFIKYWFQPALEMVRTDRGVTLFLDSFSSTFSVARVWQTSCHTHTHASEVSFSDAVPGILWL